MLRGILGRKTGMTQVFDDSGAVVPVTVVRAGPCIVMQKKTVETDGYDAIQLGFEDKKRNRANKAESGIARRCETEPKKFIREIRQSGEDCEVGDVVGADIFADVAQVDVTGTSKGKGFAGVIKRWHFQGYPGSHGATLHRGPGSIGQASDPSRVFKGMKMAGHMGNRRCTVKRVKVVSVDPERNLLFLKGGLPGANGSYLVIKAVEGAGK